MNKKKINQIVFCLYFITFFVFTIALLCFTFKSLANDKKEQTQRLKTYVTSTQTRIMSTISSMEYMHKLLNPNIYNILNCNDENEVILMLSNLYIYRNLGNEYFYSMLFLPDKNYRVITSDIDSDIIPKICQIYDRSSKDKKYTEFFYDADNNSNIIYIYNSQPVFYISTSKVENHILGNSVLIAKINIQEYCKYFKYTPSSEIKLLSDKGDQIYISERKTSSPVASEYECAISNIGNSFWKIYGTISFNTDLFANHTMFILQAFLIVSLLLIIFQIIYRKYIFKPIDQISELLGEYVILNHTIDIPEQTSYEFDKMAKYISELVSKNHELMSNIFKNQQMMYEKEIENNSYKYYALKAQINPHFLYNTLDCISSLAYINNVEPIADTVNTLSKILRYTITDNPYSSVRDELLQLKNYFSIIKTRYADKFEYHIRTDENLTDCIIPHMILQPIAENSIKHNNLYSKKIIIYVKVFSVDDQLNLVIIDNASGLCEEKIKAINEKLSAPVSVDEHTEQFSKHIGIQNINHRIKLMYGNEYGLFVSSKENLYFKTVVKLPIEKQQTDIFNTKGQIIT